MLVLAYRGGWAWFGAVLFLHLLAATEARRLLRGLTWPVPAATVYGGAVLTELGSYLRGEEGYYLAGIAVFVLFVACFLVFYPRYRLGHLAGAFWITTYLGLFSFLILLRQTYDWAFLFAVLLVTWANDTAAYYVGRKCGRHRLAPQISPQKTWEGAVAGLLAAGVVGAAAAYSGERRWEIGLGLALLVAAVGQAGDLWESALKREAGIKDTGRLLPGHGGILDRFDSLLFAAPLAYYLARWLGPLVG